MTRPAIRHIRLSKVNSIFNVTYAGRFRRNSVLKKKQKRIFIIIFPVPEIRNV